MKEERKPSGFSPFSDIVFCALALSCLYALIQNVHSPGEPSHNHQKVLNLPNDRSCRSLSGRIRSDVKELRIPYLTEDEEEPLYADGHSGVDTDRSLLIPEIYNDMKGSFWKKYDKVLTEKEKTTRIKNVMLFKNQDSQKTTDEELYEKIDQLKGPVDAATMIFVWNYFHDHERNKYIWMLEDVRETCIALADNYCVPPEYAHNQFRYVHDKMIKMLLIREKFEMKNIKQFASDAILCARWEFQRYLKYKRASWAYFTQSMERKSTEVLQECFCSFDNMNTSQMSLKLGKTHTRPASSFLAKASSAVEMFLMPCLLKWGLPSLVTHFFWAPSRHFPCAHPRGAISIS
ncbi:hypothetical protein C922_02026 [Plasmodium inui San Antonio 1]|uniref:Plasmodium RESA N-terminal domain-containing protein n=1 Tax=Plasmodium inui San Antonio 1 TaxID=1237626 RepID=W7A3L4_9APIC|nr:hypothetical protein C922_02026 [Plasmodium inui San Antonio 1]EUD67837.1 hypothetical protein C922_02026 [Plasmodium inui San Antonio 1]